MTHEEKTVSKDRMNKVIDEVISENKSLLNRLELEERDTFTKDTLIVGEVFHATSLSNTEVVIKKLPPQSRTTDPNYKSVATGDYRTFSISKENRLELTV